MGILDAISVEVPCSAGGGRYEVTLRQIMLSERMMHQGCPVPSQYTTECPPQYYVTCSAAKCDFDVAELVDELNQALQ